MPTLFDAVAANALGVPTDAAKRARAGRAWAANLQRGHLPQEPSVNWGAGAETSSAADRADGNEESRSGIGRYATRGIILAILLALPIWGALGLAAMWLFRT